MSSERWIEAGEQAVAQELGEWIARQSRNAIPSKDLEPHEFVEQDCVDCGEELDLFRKRKGRARCVECQEKYERLRR